MSIQSEAAKNHIVSLLNASYPNTPMNAAVMNDHSPIWYGEYQFAKPRKWAFDYAVPSILCANPGSLLKHLSPMFTHRVSRGIIELDGGTGGQIKKIGNEYYVRLSGHNSPEGLRNWREKNNTAMLAGWRVWHYAPEEVIKAGRKIAG